MTSLYKERPAFELLFKAVLINVRFKKELGGQITYTTKQIMDSVKSEDYASEFKGLMTLGDNMAFSVSKEYTSNKNKNLIKVANNLNTEVLGKVKIIVHGRESFTRIESIIKEENYPLEVIYLEEALEEIRNIDEEIMKEIKGKIDAPQEVVEEEDQEEGGSNV